MNEGMKLVVRAAEFAARAHARHRRKDVDETPYINHLAHVARLLAEAGADAHLVAAGYLHDTIEDVCVSYDTLLAEFGQDIADLVMAVTDDKTLRWQMRKQAQIDHAGESTERVAALKLADKVSNLCSLRDTPPHGWDMDEIAKYVEWAHCVVSRLPHLNAMLYADYKAIRGELVGRIGGVVIP
jgi:(p)ppGpp synthase/HD superfamily hydrolase